MRTLLLLAIRGVHLGLGLRLGNVRSRRKVAECAARKRNSKGQQWNEETPLHGNAPWSIEPLVGRASKKARQTTVSVWIFHNFDRDVTIADY
jgi:hypothetical protein